MTRQAASEQGNGTRTGFGSGERRARGLAHLALVGLAVWWLAGCESMNPINWYRDAAGLSEDDPSEDTRNTENLKAGGTREFPNLASVPPPPTRALSTAEREALTQRLVSDRANAKYIDDQLRGGQSAAAPRPAPSATASAAPATSTPAANAPAPSAPAPSAPTASTPAGSTPTPSAAAAPAPSPAAPPAAPVPASPAASKSSGSPSWVALTAPPPTGNPEPAEPAAREAAPPPAVDANGQPRESPLTNPTVSSLPEPESPRAPPPPPAFAQGAKSPPATTQLAARPPAVAPSATTPVAGAPVAQVTFADNSARLSPSDRRILGEVIPLQRQTGAAFRIVGYAAAGRGGNASQQLANFRMALDRANAVASVLAQAGVAPDQILVETAPPTGESGVAANRAEIFLEN